MYREVRSDLMAVYYRGHYWAAIAWSKVGKASGAASETETATTGAGKAAAKPRRKTGPSLEAAA